MTNERNDMPQGSIPPTARPSIGRIVHYFDWAAEPDIIEGPYAALIFGVDGTWNSDVPISSPFHVHLKLTCFDGDERIRHDVPVGVGYACPGEVMACWRWPERV